MFDVQQHCDKLNEARGILYNGPGLAFLFWMGLLVGLKLIGVI